MEKSERRELRLKEWSGDRGIEETDGEARIDDEEEALEAVEISDLDSDPQREAISALFLGRQCGLGFMETGFKPTALQIRRRDDFSVN